jgi:nucleotide-binding universal stress UspA family protein
MYKHILVPTDGSPLSLKAARAAAELAKTLDAKVTALYVIPSYMPPAASDGAILYNQGYTPEKYREATEKSAGEALTKIEKAAADANVKVGKVFITNDQPWQGIIDTAKAKKCDLIVMASHGRKGLSGLLIGSETTKVLTHSKTPVLVCR